MHHVKDALVSLLCLALIALIAREAPHLHDVLWNVRSATWNVSETSRALRDNSAATLTEERKILGEASEFIKLTNVQVYGVKAHPGLIPQMTTLVAKAQPVMDNLALATAKLNTAITDLDALIQSGNVTVQGVEESERRIEKLITDIDAQVADPQIKQILAELLKAAQNGAKATDEFAATTTDIRQIADKARETYLRPVNLWWAVFEKIVGLGPPIVTAIK